MKFLCRLAYAAGLGLVCASVFGQQMDSYTPPPKSIAKSAAQAQFKLEPAADQVIVLESPASADIQQLKRRNSSQSLKAKALQIGFHRDVNASFGNDTATPLNWKPVDGGLAAHLTLTSPEAVGMRIGFEIRKAPAGTEFRFAGSSEGTVIGPFQPKPSSVNPIFWGPTTEGSSATVEIFLPLGAQAADLAFEVKKVSHQLASMLKDSMVQIKQKAGADVCEIDVVCRYSDTQLKSTAASVARMSFQDLDGDSWVCTGTLLNSKVSNVPYFYTANHCIANQYEALTLETYWMYESAVCNGVARSILARALYSGSAMLYGDADSDVTLLRLYDYPPSGTVYAGWNAAALTIGTATVGIHHPSGDWKKFNAGSVLGVAAWNGEGVSVPTGSYNKVSYSEGTTEAGSSGAGLFVKNSSNGQYQLRGGLRGGASTCSNPTGSEYYSRLDLAYPNLAKYLNTIYVDVRTYVPAAAATGGYVSFLRVINKGGSSTKISVSLLDPQSGLVTASGTLNSLLFDGAAVTYTAQQVEAALGVSIPAGSRPRIRVSSDSSLIEAQSFLLQPGGVFNEVSSAQYGGSLFDVKTFIPAAAAPTGYTSYIRVINVGPSATAITAAKMDPKTGVRSNYVTLISSLAKDATVTLTADQIESALGMKFPAEERPRIRLYSDKSLIDVQSFLIQPGGAFTNVSSGQYGKSIDLNSYVPAATVGFTNFVRIINTSTTATPISVAVIDDATGTVSTTATLIASLPGGAAETVTASTIETALGRSLSASSRPRLRISGTQDLQAQSFLLQPSGAFNEVSPAASGTEVNVRTYVPAADAGSGYTSYIRVINTSGSPTTVQIAVLDGSLGFAGIKKTLVSALPAGAARTYSSSEIESVLGGPIGSGKRPRLQLTSNATITVQSFLTQPGDAFTEMSGGQSADDF